jgi:hypothetical protein
MEMFGYGFGFVGMILFIMQVIAPGPYQTAHYALGSGFMQLGFVLSKVVSGDIQQALGYRHFFLWVVLSALPVLVLTRFVRRVSDQFVSIVEVDAKARVGQDFLDDAVHFDEFFFGHGVPLVGCDPRVRMRRGRAGRHGCASGTHDGCRGVGWDEKKHWWCPRGGGASEAVRRISIQKSHYTA